MNRPIHERHAGVRMIGAGIFVMLITACASGIKNVGEYDDQIFADILRPDETILLYTSEILRGEPINHLLLTDERVILGSRSWDYAEIASVNMGTKGLVRIPFVNDVIQLRFRDESFPVNVDMFYGGRGRVKRLIRAQLEYVDQIRQELALRTEAVPTIEEQNKAVMAELRRRRNETDQRKRTVAASRLGTIGIIIGPETEVDIERECESTPIGSTGTPIDAILLPIAIVLLTNERIECLRGDREEVDAAATSVRQAMQHIDAQKQLRRRVGILAGQRLDNAILYPISRPQPTKRVDYTGAGVDTILEVTPVTALTKYGKSEGDFYGLIIKATVRVIDARTGSVLGKEQFLHTGVEHDLADVSFTAALDAGYADLASQIAKRVLEMAQDL